MNDGTPVGASEHLHLSRDDRRPGKPERGFGKLVGLDRRAAQDGKSEIRLEVSGPESPLLNEAGIVHGGAITTLVDEAIGMAVLSALPAGRWAVTAELHVHFLAPARQGELIARGRVLRVGNRLAVGEATVESAGGALVARGVGTWATVEGAAGGADSQRFRQGDGPAPRE